jgi:hypothetical protein
MSDLEKISGYKRPLQKVIVQHEPSMELSELCLIYEYDHAHSKLPFWCFFTIKIRMITGGWINIYLVTKYQDVRLLRNFPSHNLNSISSGNG